MLTNILPFFLFSLFFYLISLLDSLPIKLPSNQNKMVLCCSFIVLVIFAGCRWSSWRVGYEAGIFDYDTYKNVFEAPISIINFVNDYLDADITVRQMEIGYIWYSAFMHTIIGDHYNIFLLATNFLLIVLLFRGFKINKIFYGLWFILFFYAARLYLQYNFIMMRQAIAMMLIWFAFHYILCGKMKYYFIIVSLAFMIHFSAIICFFIPLLLKIRIKEKLFWLIVLIFFVLNITKISNSIILGGIEYILSFFDTDGARRLVNYVIMNEEESQGLNLLTFIEAIPFFYIVHYYKRDLLSTKEGHFYYNMLFVFIFLLTLTMNFSFLTRMCQYLMYSYIYLLSFYYAHSTATNRYMFFSVFGLYLLVYVFRYNMIWFYTTPYSFFLLH